MPITQERLRTLLTAAETMELIVNELTDKITEYARLAGSGALTYKDAFTELEHSILSIPTRGARIVISNEQLRYRLTNKKNAYDAARKRRQRQNYASGGIGDAVQIPSQPRLQPKSAAEIAAELDAEERQLASQDPGAEFTVGAPTDPSADSQASLDQEVERALAEMERIEKNGGNG